MEPGGSSRPPDGGVLVAQYEVADRKQHQERLDPEDFNNLRDAKRHAQTLEDAAGTQLARIFTRSHRRETKTKRCPE
jgi:hypothetical protein